MVLRYQDIGQGLGDYMTMSDLSVNPSEKQKLTSSPNGGALNNGSMVDGTNNNALTMSSDEEDEELIYCHEDNLDLIGKKRKQKVFFKRGNYS